VFVPFGASDEKATVTAPGDGHEAEIRECGEKEFRALAEANVLFWRQAEQIDHHRDFGVIHLDYGGKFKGLAQNLGGVERRSQVDIESISLDLDTAIPVGLIVNELVINALKHAFKEKSQGNVAIGLKPLDELHYELVISDDGCGMPEGFDIGASSSLGLRLVRILSKQIHGELSVSNDNGTRFRVIFNKPKIT